MWIINRIAIAFIAAKNDSFWNGSSLILRRSMRLMIEYNVEMQLIHRAEDEEEVGDHGSAVTAFLFRTTTK